MKPQKFDYHAPRTVDEALSLLQRYGGDAKFLAGGQSLMPLLNFRPSRPAALVDLSGIPSLAYTVLCRCAGDQGIVNAVRAASGRHR